jgi:hypothetical protein
MTTAQAIWSILLPRQRRAAAILFALVLVQLMVMPDVLIVENYRTMTMLGLKDTILAIGLPYMASAFGIFLLRQTFKTIPRELDEAALPAATCIGRFDGVRRLQVYWLAAREAGLPLENPRQVSAFRYPRQYGPQSPSFSRALLPPLLAWPHRFDSRGPARRHRARHADAKRLRRAGQETALPAHCGT